MGVSVHAVGPSATNSAFIKVAKCVHQGTPSSDASCNWAGGEIREDHLNEKKSLMYVLQS